MRAVPSGMVRRTELHFHRADYHNVLAAASLPQRIHLDHRLTAVLKNAAPRSVLSFANRRLPRDRYRHRRRRRALRRAPGPLWPTTTRSTPVRWCGARLLKGGDVTVGTGMLAPGTATCSGSARAATSSPTAFATAGFVNVVTQEDTDSLGRGKLVDAR